MNQELDKELCTAFPAIFCDRHADMTTTAMCWGFTHGDGWFNILYQLCNNIQHHIDWKAKQGKPVPQVVAEQVKEKFGSLRFYYRGGDDVIDGMVRMAEGMSAVTCEVCGSPGHRRGGSWIRTLCDKHEKKEEKNEIDDKLHGQEAGHYD